MRYDIDHKNQGYGNREKQTQCTVGYGVSVANVKVCLDFYLYIDGKPADHEHVEVHADGTIGEALKIVNTEYRYAVSMTFTKTPNDLTSWSTEPVDVEPGQYLFIEEKRYWSDGSVTYAYTWTRGGNNGYSNLPFIGLTVCLPEQQSFGCHIGNSLLMVYLRRNQSGALPRAR